MIRNKIIPGLRYHDARKATEFLCDAFGFEKHAVYNNEDGTVAHAQLIYEGNMIMLGSTQNMTEYSKLLQHPDEIGGFQTQAPYIIVPDIDAHYAKAKKQGAKIAIELKSEDYGGKGYSCYDLEGYLWNFGTYDPWEIVA